MVKMVELPDLPNVDPWYGEVSARSSFAAS